MLYSDPPSPITLTGRLPPFKLRCGGVLCRCKANPDSAAEMARLSCWQGGGTDAGAACRRASEA
jgi:hypothetical protein